MATTRRRTRRSRKERGSLTTSFLIGVAVGSGVALLLTPTTGREMRGRVARALTQGRQLASENGEQVAAWAATAREQLAAGAGE